MLKLRYVRRITVFRHLKNGNRPFETICHTTTGIRHPGCPGRVPHKDAALAPEASADYPLAGAHTERRSAIALKIRPEGSLWRVCLPSNGAARNDSGRLHYRDMRLQPLPYSHSIVAGGFEEMS